MILSMTGYGKAEYTYAGHKTTVEIRSLNSKQLDLTLKVGAYYREKESDIRALLSAPAVRGKVDVVIYSQDATEAASVEVDPAAPNYTPIQKDAFQYYYRELTALQSELGMPGNIDIMGAILRMPGVVSANDNDNDNHNHNDNIGEEEWQMLQAAIQSALEGFIAFRTQEGASLEKMFTAKLDGIASLLAEVEPYEKNRVANIRQRLLTNLDKLADETKQAVDQNRLEAELIYYLEKLDITEEKVRLTNHIRYFRETMATAPAEGVGKKLGFIAQEMGREINTLGSKSNQSEMQIIVVKMKDILEQIKEQVLNVL